MEDTMQQDRRTDDDATLRGRFELMPKWLPVFMTIGAVIFSATMAWGANVYTNQDQNKRLDQLEVQSRSDHDAIISMKEQVKFLAEQFGYKEKHP